MDNVGTVGPACRQGNRKILTHDFTHRKHMDIFEGTYYPPELSDWWMDDWISGVYGPDRTLRADVVEVVHHTGKHGQRYGVDKSRAAPRPPPPPREARDPPPPPPPQARGPPQGPPRLGQPENPGLHRQAQGRRRAAAQGLLAVPRQAPPVGRPPPRPPRAAGVT